MKLKQVKSVEQIENLALERKSVIAINRGNKPMPAAVMISMQCRCVLAYIKHGLYVYEPKKKTGFNTKDFKTV